MACEKYFDWMMDAALGALPPARESEFLSHIAGCRACGDSYQRARSLAAVVDRGVKSLVSPGPSPHFEARLRARLAEEPSPRSAGRLVWIPLGAAALAVAAVVTLFLIRALDRALVRPADRRVQPPVSVALRPDALTPQQAPGTIYEQAARTAQPLSTYSVPRPPSSEPHARQPEILVPPGQWDAVRNFAEAIRDGRVDGAQLIKAQQQDADGPLTIAPVEISPLDIPQMKTSGDSTGRS
jgi:hypothetical protein